MPKEITDIKLFVKLSHEKEAQFVKIKRMPTAVKFKLRLTHYLYSLTVNDVAKAEKIISAFPPGLRRDNIT